MPDSRPKVVVTGVSGNLGRRLLPLLTDSFDVLGVDLNPPSGDTSLHRFYSLDLGRESSCDALVDLISENEVQAVVHLAFVIDPVRTGVIDVGRMWQINVAGTARVIEAIARVNRTQPTVTKFIFPSSVSAYGPETPPNVVETHPLGAHTLPYAIHKQESDDVVRERAHQMGACTTYILRPHIFTGATVQNYLVGALRGTPLGKGKWGDKLRAKGTRLPLVIPYGGNRLQKRFQFVHVDDMARLLAWIVQRPEKKPGETVILNVAGRGESLTFQRCSEIANQKIVRAPHWACRKMLKFIWDRGISSIPPEALPYMIGSYTMDTTRLRLLLGSDYENVMQYTIEEALADSFKEPTGEAPAWKRPLTVATNS